jgi:hypothetical protein
MPSTCRNGELGPRMSSNNSQLLKRFRRQFQLLAPGQHCSWEEPRSDTAEYVQPPASGLFQAKLALVDFLRLKCGPSQAIPTAQLIAGTEAVSRLPEGDLVWAVYDLAKDGMLEVCAPQGWSERQNAYGARSISAPFADNTCGHTTTYEVPVMQGVVAPTEALWIWRQSNDSAASASLDPSRPQVIGDRPPSAGKPSQVASIPSRPDPSRAKRRAIPRDEANIAVRQYSRENPTASAREMSRMIGIAQGTLPKLSAWIAHVVRKRKSAAMRQSNTKTKRLTRWMLASIGREYDLDQGIEVEEAAWQYVLDNAKPAERTVLHRKKPEEKAQLIQQVIDSHAESHDDGSLESI